MQTKLKYILVSFILLLTLTAYSQAAKDKFIVVLDAGHGGHDPGRPTKVDTEKKIALNIVLKIGEMLEKYDDIKVIYTRKTDVFVDLHERGAIANRADADLFVSIHCNAHDTQAYGAESWVLGTKRGETNFNVAKAENEVILLEDDYEKHYEGYNPNAPESIIGLMLMNEDYLDQSILLATYIQNNFENKLKRKNRGVKQEGFIVLHQTYMPSVLIETGFITNLKEGKYLSSDKGQTEMATSIKDAILKYRNSLNGVDDDLIIGTSGEVYANHSDSEIYPDITFKVQIAASTRKLETKSYNFKGLSNISREQINGIYKYYYGSTSNYNTIKAQKLEALEKGYSSCFIVAIKNGKQIPLSDALKTSSN
jgi:N-acetylmuramoyl-L-alanine amidase